MNIGWDMRSKDADMRTNCDRLSRRMCKRGRRKRKCIQQKKEGDAVVNKDWKVYIWAHSIVFFFLSLSVFFSSFLGRINHSETTTAVWGKAQGRGKKKGLVGSIKDSQQHQRKKRERTRKRDSLVLPQQASLSFLSSLVASFSYFPLL